MAAEFERRKVLECVAAGRDVEELSDAKIPFARVLTHLRRLLKEGLLLYEGGRLTVSAKGREILAEPAAPSPQSSRSVDPLEAAKTQKQDIEAIQLPLFEED